MQKLTAMEKRFIHYVSLGNNNTQAAREAGYSEKNLSSMASQLSTRPRIKEALAEIQNKLAETFNITREEVVGNLRNVYAESMKQQKVYDRNGKAIEDAYTFQPAPAVRATELMGRSIGMWQNAQVHINLTEFTINIDRAGDESEEDSEDTVDGMFNAYPELPSTDIPD